MKATNVLCSWNKKLIDELDCWCFHCMVRHADQVASYWQKDAICGINPREIRVVVMVYRCRRNWTVFSNDWHHLLWESHRIPFNQQAQCDENIWKIATHIDNNRVPCVFFNIFSFVVNICWYLPPRIHTLERETVKVWNKLRSLNLSFHSGWFVNPGISPVT